MLVRRERNDGAVPIWFVTNETWPKVRAGLPETAQAFAAACGFEPVPGRCQILPSCEGTMVCVLFGIEPEDARVRDLFLPGQLADLLPPGAYSFANRPHDAALAALSWVLSSYRFARYKADGVEPPKLCIPDGVDAARIERIAKGVALGRDLINTPANDMDPEALEAAVLSLAVQ
ncbi:MAG: leucyl aminopeptidase family protein, partial [Beijerinckiaceae bacterium]|nr:leucyl aminopeptidase family protein [Beijerinckiaceae bacterium]